MHTMWKTFPNVPQEEKIHFMTYKELLDSAKIEQAKKPLNELSTFSSDNEESIPEQNHSTLKL